MFKLPDLPYAYGALAPTIGETTMRTHHDKHHAKYVQTTNELLGASNAHPTSLEAVIREAVSGGQTKLINNASQAWNHAFFWECMTPNAGAPSAELEAAIKTAFGDLEGFKAAFVKEGAAHFGSGWVWLVSKAGKLSVISTHDGQAVLPGGEASPILMCDVWEHAYYLDYKNDREGFLKAWVAKLANWSFATAQFTAASGQGEAYRYPAPMAKAA